MRQGTGALAERRAGVGLSAASGAGHGGPGLPAGGGALLKHGVPQFARPKPSQGGLQLARMNARLMVGRDAALRALVQHSPDRV